MIENAFALSILKKLMYKQTSKPSHRLELRMYMKRQLHEGACITEITFEQANFQVTFFPTLLPASLNW